MTSPKPFTIDVPQAHLDRLKAKLELSEYPDQLPDVDWEGMEKIIYNESFIFSLNFFF